MRVVPPGGYRGYWARKVTDEQYLQRIRARSRSLPNGCIQWTGNANYKGYGMMSYRNDMWMAHRLVYKLKVGLIPAGMFVCHRCDNPGCINPKHLWLGTNSSNQRDAALKGRHQETKKTHCPRGHVYNAANTYLTPRRGLRNCKLCARIRTRLALGWSEKEAATTPLIPPGQPTKRRYVHA